MPTKREHVEGRRIDDGELHLSSQVDRALKKARRTQRVDDNQGSGFADKGDARDAANGTHSNEASSSRDGAESGEEAGDEGTSSEDDGELQIDVDRHRNLRKYAAESSDKDHGPSHLQRTSTLAPKNSKRAASKEVDIGRSDGESDEDALENKEIEKDHTPRRRGMTKDDINSDSSLSSSNISDGESSEEEDESDDGEKRPDNSTAFGRAFQKIMKKKLPSTALTEAMGPMLSAHKQLVAKKLEEAAEGQKVKRESKKEKQALREKGHIVPALFPAAKDKELLKLATRGVVKLFNAVSKAQSVQESAVSKDSEAKEVAKRSKSTFLAMLQGGNGTASQSLNTQRQPLDSEKEGVADGQPGWSALQETFMLGKSRLKDWDRKQDDAADLKGAESSGDDSDSSE